MRVSRFVGLGEGDLEDIHCEINVAEITLAHLLIPPPSLMEAFV